MAAANTDIRPLAGRAGAVDDRAAPDQHVEGRGLRGGTGDERGAQREQWNDGSNTLAIAPGVVVTYDRNYVSNELMRRNGLEVLEIPGAELGRGRGGPRCMSMPIWREDI